MDRPSHEAPSPAPRSRVTASPLSRQPETSFDAAAALHRSGRLDAAAAAYRDILAREPANPTCLQLLGLLHLQQGELAEAAVRLGEAIACGLDTPEAHYHRGLVLDELQRPEEAILCYRAALAREPAHVGALEALAGALARRGRQDEALACRREAVRHRPPDAASATPFTGSAAATRLSPPIAAPSRSIPPAPRRITISASPSIAPARRKPPSRAAAAPSRRSPITRRRTTTSASPSARSGAMRRPSPPFAQPSPATPPRSRRRSISATRCNVSHDTQSP